MNKTNKNLVTQENGQALLFVVLAMTIALTVGVGISTRTLHSTRRTTSTDTAARVLSAAEGGVEWFLVQPIDVLARLADGDTSNGVECPNGTTWDSQNPTACILSYQKQEGDEISTKAAISVNEFEFNSDSSSEDHYWFNLPSGDVKEVTTKNYKNGTFYQGPLDICWESLDENQAASIYYLAYNSDGVQAKGIINPSASAAGGTSNVEGDVTANSGKTGTDFTSCYTINIGAGENWEGVRFKSLYANAKIGVFPGAGFPTQGFKITSLGEIANVSEKVKTIKEVVVYKSLPYAPSVFDYAIYSNQTID